MFSPKSQLFYECALKRKIMARETKLTVKSTLFTAFKKKIYIIHSFYTESRNPRHFSCKRRRHFLYAVLEFTLALRSTVYYGDSFKLESAKIERMFLHVSKEKK